MTQQVRVLHPVTFFDGKNDHPHAVADFTPQEHDPKAEALFAMPEPTPEELAAVEALAVVGLTEDPEAGVTQPADDGQVEGQLTLPLDVEPEPTEPDAGKKSSGKVPPA